MTRLERISSHAAKLAESGSLQQIAGWATRNILLVSTCLLLVFVLARADDWLFRNETFAWISGVFAVDPADPSLVRFHDRAVENCARAVQNSQDVCRDYQATFFGSTVLFHPLNELFASTLPMRYGHRPWLEDLHWAATGTLLVGGFLAIGLWLLLVIGLPRGDRGIMAVLTVLLLLFGHYRDEPALLVPDPFADGVGMAEVAGLFVISALVFGQRWAGPYLLHGRLDLTGKAGKYRRRLFQGLWVAVLLNFILPQFGAGAVQLVTLCAFLVAAWWVMEVEEWPPMMAGAILVFLFIMISGDHFYLLRKLETARHQLYLVFGAYLVYVAARPRGSLIYLLPALAVFHVPAAALLGLALCLAEIPLCLRRMQISRLFVVSAVTFAIWYWVMQRNAVELGNSSSLALTESLQWVLESSNLWPAVFTIGLLAGISLWPLALRTRAYDHVARCGFLALQGFGVSVFSLTILDHVPASSLKAEYFMLIWLPAYLGPAIAFGVVLSLSLVLFDLGKHRQSDQFEVASEGGIDWRQLSPVLGLVFLIAITKIDLAPRFLLVDAVRNSVSYIALQNIHPDWCRYLAPGAGFDDYYILSVQDPTAGAENAFSALKLKLRLSLGVHEPDQMVISTVEPQDGGC